MSDKTGAWVLFRRTSRIASAERSTDRNNGQDTETSNGECQGPHDQNVQSLIHSLSPLLNCMRLGGQYFRCSPSDSAYGEFDASSGRLAMAYAVIVLILLWINSARMLTVFTSNDEALPAILNKLMFVTWNAQCAIQQSTYFLACRSGRLDRVLRDVQLKSRACSECFRKRAVKFAAVMSLDLNDDETMGSHGR